jgi:CubicO group peptidase (beta-lactamase class C family)
MRLSTRAGAGCAFMAVLLVSLWGQGVAHTRQQKGSPPAALPRAASLVQVTTRLEQLIPRLIQEGTVPGLSIALIRNGKLAWQHGFGLANAETKAPVTNDSVFEAASLSKPVFAFLGPRLGTREHARWSRVLALGRQRQQQGVHRRVREIEDGRGDLC